MRILQLIILCLLAGPAWANAQMAANQCERITLAGTVADYDIGCANSWPGAGQILRNMVPLASAAETGAQDSVNIVFGGSTLAASNDPTPTGKAGRESTYLAFDGGDALKWSAQTGTDQTVADGWVDNWHIDSGEDHTIAFTFCFDSGGGSETQTLAATKAPGTNKGLIFFVNSSEKLSVTQRGDSAAVTIASTATLVDGTCYIVGYAHSHSGNTSKLWVGSSTGEEIAHNFNDTTAASTTFLIFGSSIDNTMSSLSLGLVTNTKLYGIYVNNTYMDDTAFGNLLTVMQNRHSDVDFTP